MHEAAATEPTPAAGDARSLDAEQRARVRAGIVSLLVGGGILGVKFAAYALTGSTALLSDALESIVNVLAAAFLLGSVVFAGIPADRNHPYGHGKIEFLSAAFEGGLISFAALSILAASVRAFLRPQPLVELDAGLGLTAVGIAANAALGAYLVRVGRRADSLALVADGQHVLSDVLTSVGVLVGLGLVRVTGLAWIDPLVAAIVGLLLAATGFRLVRRAAGGLLDEEDTETIGGLLRVLEDERPPGLIRIHHLRAMRAGRRTHVDAHLVMPEFWPVERAHALCDGMERLLARRLAGQPDVMFHSDPCRRAYCSGCEIEPCSVRVEPFVARPPLTLEEAVRPDVA